MEEQKPKGVFSTEADNVLKNNAGSASGPGMIKGLSKGLMILIGGIGLVIIIGLWLMAARNGLVTSRNEVDTKWSNVQTQLQRRFDLIPNLVETVKGAQIQEQKVFSDIAEARSNYAGDPSPATAGQVESALSRLLAIVEAYPELKSNENVLKLQDQLEGSENRVSTERTRYNEAVKAYNNKVELFPGSIAAGILNFDKRQPFEATPEAQSVPRVDFNSDQQTESGQ